MEDQRDIIVINSRSNLEYLGFKKYKDPLRFISKGSMLLFIVFFFLAIIDAFYEKKLFFNHFCIVSVIIMLMSIIIGKSSVCISRMCPICKKKMKRISPEDNDTQHSYKHYCGFCKVYLDTEIYNSSD